jgi:hypothetical protein
LDVTLLLPSAPSPGGGAYRFAPDPISKRKRKEIAENPQDKPLRAVVRFAILGTSPNGILDSSVSHVRICADHSALTSR